jgi:hypothetical protein
MGSGPATTGFGCALGDHSWVGSGTIRRFHEFEGCAVLRLRKQRQMVDPHERPVVTEQNKVAVRAGSTGNHVRYVLIASTALVIVCFIAIALFVKA